MSKRVAVVGDSTTTGGKVITGQPSFFCDGRDVACIGDKVSCPACKGIGTIIEGEPTFNIQGKPAALDGHQIVCGCPAGTNRLIAIHSRMFVEDTSNRRVQAHTASLSRASSHTSSASTASQSQKSYPWFSAVASDRTYSEEEVCRLRIREDAQSLINCAEELGKKHLYYPDIRADFNRDVKQFANQIVSEVDSGNKSYEQGSYELKTEEKSLTEQALELSIHGLSLIGGIGQMMSGAAVCLAAPMSPACWFIGAPLMLHGVNSLQEGYRGARGFFDEQYQDKNNPGYLKQGYQDLAQALGYPANYGEVVYHTVDLSLSVHGLLKNVLKTSLPGDPNKLFRPWKLWRYGYWDFERAYKQMTKRALFTEIVGDLFILRDIKNALLINKETNETTLILNDPNDIKTAEDLLDDEKCIPVIVITGNGDSSPTYYRCYNSKGKVTREIR